MSVLQANLPQELVQVSPKDDFYYYVNKEWLENNPIPSDYSMWSSFHELMELTNSRVKNLFDQTNENSVSSPDLNWQKVLTIWSSGNDETSLNSDENFFKSVGDIITEINNVSNMADLNLLMMTKLFMQGVTSVIDFGACPDSKNSKLNILWIDRNNLGLPDRDYYFNEKLAEKVSSYKLFMVQTLDWLKNKFANKINFTYGLEELGSEDLAKKIFDLEMILANSMLTMNDRRDPSKIYNPMSLSEIKEKYYNIDWDKIFSVLNITVADNIVCIQEPKFFETLNNLLTAEHIETFKYYMMLKVIWSTYQFLSDDVNDMCFNFYGTILNGQHTQKPRWKRVMSIIDSLVGELVGKKYCSLYFTQESKDLMLLMVKNITNTFRHKINNLSWMTDLTKSKALEKLDTLRVKIGFPDRWENYDNLNISTSDTYCQHIIECYKFKTIKNLEECYKSVDREKWHMFPHQINAYYNPTQNEIVFPAGILQYPFFDPNQPSAVNYGGICAVISHEIGHAFDDSGSQFDADGNLNDWWTEQDKENYKNATQKMIKQFSSYVMEGMNLNGELELGENIADYSGVTIALSALISYCKENNYDKNEIDKQIDLFFKSFATIWRNNIRPDALKNRIISDPHAPGYYITNGILSNIPEFYELYSVTKSDRMYLEPSERTILW